MNPTYDFTGQVALVTGASSGMGLATAQAFAEAGAAVVLADINDQTLGAATDELTASGYRALAVTCDVANEDQAAAMWLGYPRTYTDVTGLVRRCRLGVVQQVLWAGFAGQASQGPRDQGRATRRRRAGAESTMTPIRPRTRATQLR